MWRARQKLSVFVCLSVTHHSLKLIYSILYLCYNLSVCHLRAFVCPIVLKIVISSNYKVCISNYIQIANVQPFSPKYEKIFIHYLNYFHNGLHKHFNNLQPFSSIKQLVLVCYYTVISNLNKLLRCAELCTCTSLIYNHFLSMKKNQYLTLSLIYKLS